MKNRPQVYIVILNWNRAADTDECIKSVLKTGYRDFRIILVDNGSSEPESKKIAEKYPGIIFIQNEKNLGYAGGNNAGIKDAYGRGADYVLILNNDTVVEKNFLAELVSAAEMNADAGMLGPLNLDYGEPDKILSSGGKIYWPAGMLTHSNDLPYGIREAGHLQGSALLVKREVLEKTGWFDESFFAYCEETDWCVRAKKSGFKLLVVPSAKIWHKQSVSTGGPSSPKSLYYWTRNRLLFMKKNAPPAVFIFFTVFIFPIITLRNLWRWRGSKTHIVSLLRGIADFFRGRFGEYGYSD